MFSNGNGGPHDDCAASGHQSSMYTISIGSIGIDGRPSSYDEECSAKMAVTYVTNTEGDHTVVCNLNICINLCNHSERFSVHYKPAGKVQNGLWWN